MEVNALLHQTTVSVYVVAIGERKTVRHVHRRFMISGRQNLVRLHEGHEEHEESCPSEGSENK